MNVWSFTGNLGRDAELRHTNSGDAVASFSVAVKSGFGDKAKTTWPRCSLWGKQAESLTQYLRKGQLVGITGEVTMTEYEKDGVTRQSLDVRVSSVTLLGKKDESTQAPRPQAEKPAAQSFDDFGGDDIPF